MRETLTYNDVLLKPKRGVLSKREDADISSDVVPGIKIRIPILSANMPSVTGFEMIRAMDYAGGYAVMHRFTDAVISDYICASGFKRGVSLGLKDGIEIARKILDRDGNPVFFLDVAHGHHDQVIRFLSRFRTEFGRAPKLVIGNVATHDAIYDLLDSRLGIDGFKVGVGPGAVCTTRDVTGFGVGQLSAIMDVSDALDAAALDYEVRPTIIADGGIQTSGDIVKALAAGADTVMVGSLLAGCNEAPEPGVYYGNASKHVNGHHAPEGILGSVPRSGSVADTIKRLSWGIRSGISYGGATNIQELRENAEWLKVSSHTSIESGTRV